MLSQHISFRYFTLTTRLVLLTIAFSVGSASISRSEDLDEKKAVAAIDRALDAWQVPGVAVAIVSNDHVIWMGGRGVREQGDPAQVTADTVFPLASCSKGFTTTLLAMLSDEGRLDWDDRVGKHVNNFHLSDPLADGDVRLRDLVSHRTGVAGHDLLWYRAPWSQDEQIRRVGLLPLSKPFRSAMQYQSIMFIAAGKAVENASGRKWDELIRQRIFMPLSMKSGALTSADALKFTDHAMPHGKGKAGIEKIPLYVMAEPNAAGSVHVSARDLVPWLQLHLNEGTHGEVRLVSAKNLKTTHTPQIVIPMDEANQRMHPFTQQMSYGMGWVIQDYRGELLVSHAGLIDGFRAHLTLLPKRKLGLAILTNLDQTRMNLALSNELVDMLLGVPAKDWNAHYREIVESQEFAARVQAARIERARKKGTKPALELALYAGVYEEPAYGTAKVGMENGELFLDWSSFHGKLDHFQDEFFRVRDEELGRTPLEFHVSDGKVEAMTAVGVRFKRKESPK